MGEGAGYAGGIMSAALDGAENGHFYVWQNMQNLISGELY